MHRGKNEKKSKDDAMMKGLKVSIFETKGKGNDASKGDSTLTDGLRDSIAISLLG